MEVSHLKYGHHETKLQGPATDAVQVEGNRRQRGGEAAGELDAHRAVLEQKGGPPLLRVFWGEKSFFQKKMFLEKISKEELKE